MEKNNPKYDASNIKVISSVDAIRFRPRMYFEQCFQDGNLDSLPIEVACHAIDEFIDGKCKQLEISVAKAHYSLVYDAGMDLKVLGEDEGETIAETLFTTQYACSNRKKHLEVGEKHCGIGMMVVNAAALWCEVETVSSGKKGVFKFEKGETVFRSLNATDESDFTSITIHPDRDLLNGLEFTYAGIKAKAETLAGELPGFEIQVIEGGL